MARQAQGSALTCELVLSPKMSSEEKSKRRGNLILLTVVGGIFAGWISP